MSDPEAVARCMPGAYLDGPPQDGRLKGRIEVKLGPVAASFAGEGTVTPYPSEYRQVIEGRGVDRKGGSRVSGSVDYRLSENPGGAATRVEVVIGYALTGLLAQLGRSGLARDLAQRIGEAFAQNIDARLRRTSGGAAPQIPVERLCPHSFGHDSAPAGASRKGYRLARVTGFTCQRRGTTRLPQQALRICTWSPLPCLRKRSASSRSGTGRPRPTRRRGRPRTRCCSPSTWPSPPRSWAWTGRTSGCTISPAN